MPRWESGGHVNSAYEVEDSQADERSVRNALLPDSAADLSATRMQVLSSAVKYG